LIGSENIFPDPGGSLSLFRKKLPIRSIVLRTLRHFYYSSEEEEITVDNNIVESPLCITGAGDAQNAGICLGILGGLSMHKALEAGVWSGNSYIRTGTVEPLYLEDKYINL
jgi:sugar/nucleoside kinase (ribokinase family)